MKFLFFSLLITSSCLGQSETPEIDNINKQLDSIAHLKVQLRSQLEGLKLTWIQNEINRIGVPKSESKEETIIHSAYQLSYNEEHEQANWLIHMILPDIINGNHSRSNDFREDPFIKAAQLKR